MVKVPGKVTSRGSSRGTDARQPQAIRPLLTLLVLVVMVFGTVYGTLFLIAAITRNDVRHLFQEKCGISSTSVAGAAFTDSEAKVTYVDSTGAHTAIVYLGTGRKYFLSTCGR